MKQFLNFQRKRYYQKLFFYSFIFFSFSITCSLQTKAATPSSLSLSQVISSVERHFPLLLAASKEKTIADGELLSAQGNFDPKWTTSANSQVLGYYRSFSLDSVLSQPTPLWGTSLFAGYRLGSGSFAVYDAKNETAQMGEVRAGVSVPLWRNGPIDSRRASIWQAQISPRLAELSITQQRIEFVRAASIRYWNWVEVGRNLAITRALLEIAEARDKALEERAARGDIPRIDQLENVRAVLNRKAQVVSAERMFTNATLELSLFMRTSTGEPFQLTASHVPEQFPEPISLPASNTQQIIAKAIKNRPEIERIERLTEQTNVELRAARNQQMPAIDLRAMVSKDIGSGDYTYARLPLDVQIGVVLDIPILARSAAGKEQTAQAKIERYQTQKSFLYQRIATDVRDALVAETAARQRVSIARKELELARKLESLERENFSLGNATMLIVNLREQATADAAMREVNALADHQRALVAFRAAMANQ